MRKIHRIVFLLTLFFLLSCHNILYLALSIILFYIIDLKNFKKLNKKVLHSIFLFNLAITISYAIMFLFNKDLNLWYLLYINLKVYAITYFVAFFFSKVDMVQFFAFSKDLSFLLTITLSQIISYKKSFYDLKTALKARVIKRLREKGFILKVFDFFFQKAMQDSNQRVLAMKARRFFD